MTSFPASAARPVEASCSFPTRARRCREGTPGSLVGLPTRRVRPRRRVGAWPPSSNGTETIANRHKPWFLAGTDGDTRTSENHGVARDRSQRVFGGAFPPIISRLTGGRGPTIDGAVIVSVRLLLAGQLGHVAGEVLGVLAPEQPADCGRQWITP
jgi:hypothetical protein